MNCKDLEGLLSAYADGELAGTQRDFIEEHLESCADCRATLADYTKTREQLLSLRAIPSIPDIKQATMSKIKMAGTTVKLRRWLRPALVGIPVIAILATVLPLYLSGSSLSPAGVIAKAYAATEGLRSYRSVDNEYWKLRETDDLIRFCYCKSEYTFPDRYHVIRGYTEESPYEYFQEIIVIGDKVYDLGGGDYWNPENVKWLGEDIPTKERTLELLDLLIDIETMPDETMDGVDCYHYRGTVDIEKFLDWSRPYLERLFKDIIERYPTWNFDLEEMFRTAEDMWRTKKIEYELWIGKDDYLIRQLMYVMQTLPDQPVLVGGVYLVIATVKYYDFNELIVIEPPLTESGELLEGWRVTSLEE